MLTLTTFSALLAGAVHVLSGPDHMAAVAPLAILDRRRGWFAGWTWGLGHTAGVVLVAVIAVMVRDLLPPIEAISSWAERLVGVALIGVGIWALCTAFQIRKAPHTHDGMAHAHLHVSRGPALARRLGHPHAAFLMGVLHGIAGSSHFLGVLPALALPTRAEALTYVALFGASTVAAMTGFAAVIGVAAGGSAARGDRVHRAMTAASAAVAFIVGVAWMVG